MGLFTSPQEEQGKKEYKYQLRAWDRHLGTVSNLYQQAKNLPDFLSGVSDMGSFRKFFDMPKFDLGKYTSGIEDIYGQARRNLGTTQAGSRSALRGRMSGRNATPEQAFMPLESQFAGAFGNLAGGEAREKLGAKDKARTFSMQDAYALMNVLGQRNQFGLGKLGAQSNILGQYGQGLGGRGGAVSDYISMLSSSSPFEDILGAAGNIAGLGSGLGLWGKPKGMFGG